jgi:hypothetical protein
MIDKTAEKLAKTINELRMSQNDAEIAFALIGAAVPCMIEAGGAKHTADFLRNLASRIEKESDPLNAVN